MDHVRPGARRPDGGRVQAVPAQCHDPAPGGGGIGAVPWGPAKPLRLCAFRRSAARAAAQVPGGSGTFRVPLPGVLRTGSAALQIVGAGGTR